MLGQTQDLDFLLSVRADAGGRRLRHGPASSTRSPSEIATNVTAQQLRDPAAGQPQLPEFRASWRPASRLSTIQSNQEGPRAARCRASTSNVFIDGTSYKNDVLQRRRRRPGRQPRQPVSAERGAGVPGHHPELQGRVREVLERPHHGRHQVGRQRLPRRRFRRVPEQGPRRPRTTAPSSIGCTRRAADPRRSPSPTTRAGRPAFRSAVRSCKDAVHFFGSWEYNQQDYATPWSLGPQIGEIPQPVHDALDSLQRELREPRSRRTWLFGKVSCQAAQADVIDTSGFYAQGEGHQ